MLTMNDKLNLEVIASELGRDVPPMLRTMDQMGKTGKRGGIPTELGVYD